MMSLIDLSISCKKWTGTFSGVEITFFKMELPASKTFGGKWLGWFESDLYDGDPKEFASEPSQAEVETLYTG